MPARLRVRSARSSVRMAPDVDPIGTPCRSAGEGPRSADRQEGCRGILLGAYLVNLVPEALNAFPSQPPSKARASLKLRGRYMGYEAPQPEAKSSGAEGQGGEGVPGGDRQGEEARVLKVEGGNADTTGGHLRSRWRHALGARQVVRGRAACERSAGVRNHDLRGVGTGSDRACRRARRTR